MGKRGHSLIFGAGDNGMMGAVARGVSENQGEIIGIGKHDELMESCVPYKEISDSQMGGAFVE